MCDGFWRSEYLNRIPTKVLSGQILVHNRVLPPAPDSKPGLDGFYAFLLHPIDRERVRDNPYERCSCNWLPELGVHFIFPGDEIIAFPERDLRVEDLVESRRADQWASRTVGPQADFGLLTMTSVGTGGEAFLVDPDGRVGKLVWRTADTINFEELQPPESGHLLRSESIAPDLLSSALPELRAQWETWRTAQPE